MSGDNPTHRASWGHYKPPFWPFLPNQALTPTGTAPGDAPYICLRINRSWIPFLLGAVEVLADERIYDPLQPGIADMVGRIPELQSIIANGNMECEGEPMQLRQNPTSPCLLEQSNDGGNTWTLAFDYSKCTGKAVKYMVDIDTIITSFTTLNETMIVYDNDITNVCPDWEYGDEHDTWRDEVLCHVMQDMVKLACRLSASLLQDAEGQYHDQLHEYQRAYEIAAGIATELSVIGFLALPAAVAAIGCAWTAIGIEVYDEFFVNPPDLSAFEDAEAIENVACHIYCDLKDKTPSFGTFRASLDNTGSVGNEAIIEQAVRLFLLTEEFFVSYFQLVGEIIDLEGLIELSCPCLCPETPWYHVINLADALPVGLVVDYGTWVNGQGITHADAKQPDNWYYRTCQATLTMPTSAHLTKVAYTFNRSFGPWTNTSAYADYIFTHPDETTYGRMQKDAPVGIGKIWYTDLDNSIFTGFTFGIHCSRQDHAHYGGAGLLTKVEIWGTGDNPFE